MTLLTDLTAAAPEWEALGQALTALDRPTPCQLDPEPFGSDDRAERREAAAACGWCPALEPCRIYAEAARETWLVWAGVDRGSAAARADRQEVAA